MNYSDCGYNVLYDNKTPMCFVGNTVYNKLLYEHWKDKRPCLLHTIEEVELKSQQWADQHQFMCAVSNVGFKRLVVEKLSKFNPHYFSIVGNNNNFINVDIGVGTFVQNYNTAVFDNPKIGNHCTVTSYTVLGHDSVIGDFCHVSAYCFVNYTNLQEGNLLAIRCSTLGRPGAVLDIAPNCNFMIGSTVTSPITETGTYFGNRLASKESSLTYKLL